MNDHSGPLLPVHQRDNNLNALLCAMIVVVCLLATRPFASMGMIDDWSYVKTAQMYARTHHFIYNNWGAVILGWQAPVSALGIKLFGPYFTAARLYTLPMTLLGAWLFYLVLDGFDLGARNAAFGTFALFLSWICLPLEFTSMTDVPGMVVVLVCLFLCQQAVRARTASATLGWLSAAAVTNVVGGTVRQLAWLGVLVMVPATAWLLRRRRGVLAAGIVLALLGAVAIQGVLLWFRHQPLIVAKMSGIPWDKRAIAHLLLQLVRAYLSLQLLLLPLLLGWLWMGWKRGGRFRAAILVVAILALAVFAALPHLGKHGRPETWLAPFSLGVMGTLGLAPPGLAEMLGRPDLLPLGLRITLSALVVTAAFAFLMFLRPSFSSTAMRRAVQSKFWRGKASQEISLASSGAIFWLLVPFLAAYLALLLPLGLAGMIFDRYLMPVLAIALVFLLRFYQETIAPSVQRLSVLAMLAVALYSIAGTHDVWALYRARVTAGNQMIDSGVPRTAIQGGFDYDGLTQIEATGYIVNNHDGIHVVDLPEECGDWFSGSTPAVHPQYFVMRAPVSCFEPASYPNVLYRAWLPPFHRKVMIGKLRKEYLSTPYITMDFPPRP